MYAGMFYVLLQWIAASWAGQWWLGYSTAAVAAMLAAQGVPWRRKVVFAGGTAGLSILLLEVVVLSPVGGAANVLRSSAAGAASELQLAAFVGVQVIFIGVPLAALAAFVGGRPSVLWTGLDTPKSA